MTGGLAKKVSLTGCAFSGGNTLPGFQPVLTAEGPLGDGERSGVDVAGGVETSVLSTGVAAGVAPLNCAREMDARSKRQTIAGKTRVI